MVSPAICESDQWLDRSAAIDISGLGSEGEDCRPAARIGGGRGRRKAPRDGRRSYLCDRAGERPGEVGAGGKILPRRPA
jgi:hypothetical protein